MEYLQRFTNETYGDFSAPAPKEYFNKIGRLRLYLYAMNPVAFTYAPGNGTAYELLIVPKDGCLNFDAWTGTGADENEWVWVSIANHGSYQFKWRGYVDPGYVGEKLNLRSISCCCAIATLLNDLFGSWGAGRDPEEMRLKMYRQYGLLKGEDGEREAQHGGQ